MLYILLFGLGFYLLKKGLAELKKCRTFLNGCKITIGSVTDYKMVTDRNGRKIYYPVFLFKTHTNQEFPFAIGGSTEPSYAIGEEALIAYNADEPNNARLFSYFGIFKMAILFFAISLPLLIIGAGYFVFLVVV